MRRNFELKIQICYNKFAPISHVRFWGFQLMCVTMPSVGFIVYSGHKAKEKMRVEQSKKQEAKAQLMAEKVSLVFPIIKSQHD